MTPYVLHHINYKRKINASLAFGRRQWAEPPPNTAQAQKRCEEPRGARTMGQADEGCKQAFKGKGFGKAPISDSSVSLTKLRTGHVPKLHTFVQICRESGS